MHKEKISQQKEGEKKEKCRRSRDRRRTILIKAASRGNWAEEEFKKAL